MLSSILSALLLATSALALAARDDVVDARPKIFILAADGVKIQGTGTEGFDGCGGGWAVEYSENELQKTFTMQTFYSGELKCFGVPTHTFDVSHTHTLTIETRPSFSSCGYGSCAESASFVLSTHSASLASTAMTHIMPLGETRS